MIESIDQELDRVSLQAKLSRRSHSRGEQSHKLLQTRNTLTIDVRDGEDGANFFARHGLGVDTDIDIVALSTSWDGHWVLASLGRLQNFSERCKSLLVLLFRSQINLCDHDEERYSEGQGDAEMLSCHLADAHIGTDYDHGVVRHEADKTEHGRLEVLFVTTQVQERD